MAFRAFFGPLWIIFTAGAALLLFFIVLGGSRNSTPLNEFFWLEADTSKVPGAPSLTRWTFYGICHVVDGRNANCTSNKADFGFDPIHTFGTHTGLPDDFATSRDVSIRPGVLEELVE
ncbi:Fmp45p [Sugiyamaella lignohabitans]|uniref:Fmp45p n=1 Tax=Sugiyamaella lignohabitans TaxID=796027 RepID=A0A167EPV7_9ASCO|nr:Fmp45p [Sugiyamaella lignohabitans]ANB14323.1 Fmp45p [Sugiyamaella lignohabitans]